MRKEYIQSAKTELEKLQKQGNTAANRRAAEQCKSLCTPLFWQSIIFDYTNNSDGISL